MNLREHMSLFARRHLWAKRALLSILPNFQRTIRVPGIGPFRIRVRDHRCYWLRDPLEQDRLFLGGISNLMQPGMVVWDVGSHIGLYARLFAEVLGAESVVAFEPDPRNRELLAKNVRLAREPHRITIQPYALSAADETSAFFNDDDSTQRGHLVGVRGEDVGHHGGQVMVETRTVDSLVASGVCPVPGLIKIDVEGAEALVLHGARETLAHHSPLLAIELHGFEVRTPVFEELTQAGYVVFGYRSRKWRQLTAQDFANPTTLYDPRHVYAARDAERLRRPALLIDL
jgi:FkbM family methyltransferase